MDTGPPRPSIRRSNRIVLESDYQISPIGVRLSHNELVGGRCIFADDARDLPPPYSMTPVLRPLVSPLRLDMQYHTGSSSGIAPVLAPNSLLLSKARMKPSKAVLKLLRKLRPRKKAVAIVDVVNASGAPRELDNRTYVVRNSLASSEIHNSSQQLEHESRLPSYDASEREKLCRRSILYRLFHHLKRYVSFISTCYQDNSVDKHRGRNNGQENRSIDWAQVLTRAGLILAGSLVVIALVVVITLVIL